MFFSFLSSLRLERGRSDLPLTSARVLFGGGPPGIFFTAPGELNVMESAHFGICDRGSWRRASESVRPGDGANAVLEGDPGFSEAYAPPPSYSGAIGGVVLLDAFCVERDPWPPSNSEILTDDGHQGSPHAMRRWLWRLRTTLFEGLVSQARGFYRQT